MFDNLYSFINSFEVKFSGQTANTEVMYNTVKRLYDMTSLIQVLH